MLPKRSWEILKIMYNSQNKYLTSAMIASELDCSDRTARKYLNDLSKIVIKHGANLVSKQGKGFKFTIIDTLKFNSFYLSEKSKRKSLLSPMNLEDNYDRQYFILNKIFFENKNIFISDLEDIMFLSNSTIVNILNQIKELLSDYDLTLMNQEVNGISLVGSEQDKRKFILDYFFTQNEEDLLPYISTDILNSKLNLNKVTSLVLDVVRGSGFETTDIIIYNLILHISLAIIRLSEGQELEDLRISDHEISEKEYDLLKQLINTIEIEFDVQFPPNEVKYIAKYLIANHFGESDKNRLYNLEQLVQEALERISEALDEKILLDRILIEGILKHMDQLLVRLKQDITIKNPLLEQLLSDYHFEMQLCKTYLTNIPPFVDFDISDHEIGYITFHLLAAIERFHYEQKNKVLIICSTGIGASQMLQNRIEKEFGNRLKIIDVISFYELSNNHFNEVDFIISTIDINMLYLPIPIIIVDALLNKDDINNINNIIFNNEEKNIESYQEKKANEIFDVCFSEDKFLIVSEFTYKNKILDMMVPLLNHPNKSDHFVEQFKKELDVRETFGSTAFDNILAVPHPSKALTETEQIVVAIAPHGIYWNESNPSVNFVFMLSPSLISNQSIKVVSNTLVYLIQSKVFQKQLLDVHSFSEFKNVFIELLSFTNLKT